MTDIPKYPKIRHLGDDETRGLLDNDHDVIVVQEKFDGANFRFWVDGSDLIFGSRNVSNIDPADWIRQTDYLRSMIDVLQVDSDLVYCGEAAEQHSLSYRWDELPPFIGFDVLHKHTGLPLDYSVAQHKFEELDLDFMHIVWIGNANQWRKQDPEDYLTESAYRQGAPEGIVIKNYQRLNRYGRPLFAKVVTKEFQEKNKAVFGRKMVGADDTDTIIDAYATDARIRKIIRRMTVDEGRPLGRTLMGDLILETIRDILDEETVNMWREKKIDRLDFRMLHKRIPRRCLEVLDTLMMDEATS